MFSSGDKIRSNAVKPVERLSKIGFQRGMESGDGVQATQFVASKGGIEDSWGVMIMDSSSLRMTIITRS